MSLKSGSLLTALVAVLALAAPRRRRAVRRAAARAGQRRRELLRHPVHAAATTRRRSEACNDVRSPTPARSSRAACRAARCSPTARSASAPASASTCRPATTAGDLRYPVLYLLHGGGGDQGDWVSQGGVQEVFDALYRADPRSALIVVTPDGTRGRVVVRPARGRPAQRGVRPRPPHRRSSTATTARSPTAAAARSPACRTAATARCTSPRPRPTCFEAVGAMSANIGWQSFTGGAELNKSDSPGVVQRPPAAAPREQPRRPRPDAWTSARAARATPRRTPAARSPSSRSSSRTTARSSPSSTTCATPASHDYRETEGGHSWRWWPKWLGERELPFMLARLADPQPAARPVEPSPPRLPFRYRSVQTAFSVYGYDVRVDAQGARVPRPHRRHAEDGLTVRGSGRAPIHTAPLYAPRRRATSSPARGRATGWRPPDDDGRLRARRRPRARARARAVHRRAAGGREARQLLGHAPRPHRAGRRAPRPPRAGCADRRTPGRRRSTRPPHAAAARPPAAARATAAARASRTVLVAIARRTRQALPLPDVRGPARRARAAARRAATSARAAPRRGACASRARLPRGRYRVWARSLDAAGNASRTRPLRKRVPLAPRGSTAAAGCGAPPCARPRPTR